MLRRTPSRRVLKVHSDDARVRAEPFEVHEFELGMLWQR
jgi:hypothetical protein